MLNVITAVSLGRLFDEWSVAWLPLAVVILPHVLTFALAGRVPKFLEFAIASSSVLAVLWLLRSRTTQSISWWTSLQRGYDSLIRTLVRDASAATVNTDRAAIAVVAISVVVLLSLFTLRVLRSLLVAALPSAGLMGFIALTGRSEHRWVLAASFGAAMIWALKLTPGHQSEARITPSRLLPIVAVPGIGCVVALIFSALHAPPLVDWRDATRTKLPDSIELNSLESVSNWLRQPERSMFRVRAKRGEYWRAHALDVYDDSGWSLDAGTAGGSVSRGSTQENASRFAQTVTITGFNGQELLGAAQAMAVRGAAEQFPTVFSVPETQSLLMDRPAQPGDRYTVYSDIEGLASAPKPSAQTAALDAATAEALQQALRGQVDPNASVATQLEQVQAWMRGPEFGYDLNVAFDPSSAGTLNFLSGDRRIGFCQHFANAFAQIARSYGLPARLAIGFRPGTPATTGEAGDTTFSVTTKMAHTWPEVYLEGRGWVPFEPTPGSEADPIRNPQVPGSLVGAAAPPATPVPTPSIPNAPSPPSTPANPPTSASPSSTPVTPSIVPSSSAAQASAAESPDKNDVTNWHLPLLASALLLLTIVAVFWTRRRKASRSSQSETPSDQLRANWISLRTHAISQGITPDGSSTIIEESVAMRPAFSETAHSAVTTTATLLTTASYSPTAPPDEALDAAIAASSQVLKDLESPEVLGEDQPRKRR